MTLSDFPDEAIYRAMIEQLLAEPQSWFGLLPRSSSTLKQVAALPATAKLSFIRTAVKWLKQRDALPVNSARFDEDRRLSKALLDLLDETPPFPASDLLAFLDWATLKYVFYEEEIRQVVTWLEKALATQPLTPALQQKLLAYASAVQVGVRSTTNLKLAARLRDLSGLEQAVNPLVPVEPWATAATQTIAALPDAEQTAWLRLLNHCAQVLTAAPNKKWLKQTAPELEIIGFAQFKACLLEWFELAQQVPAREPSAAAETTRTTFGVSSGALLEVNADILKGLVWLAAQNADQELARALMALAVSAYRKLPGVGPRCVRVGNACVWALGNMPGTEGIAQLALLKLKVKFGSAQRSIEKALQAAAQRSGLSAEEIAEMSVPTYGLQTVGCRREQLGDFTAELLVTGTHQTELRWHKSDGKTQATVPKAVKEAYRAELKELQQTAKDIQQMLLAQRELTENFYLEQRRWPFTLWQTRYLNHPLLGTLARRLIWRFSDAGRSRSGAWLNESLVDLTDAPLLELTETTQVELWHPLDEPTTTVLAWRDWLDKHEIRQPFKQAHREIYVLTDAERRTHTYSNRFAAHIIKQHQFNALCGARAWKNKLRLMVDDSYPPPQRLLPSWNLRAEFWVESIGDNFGTDTNESGTYLYLTTDQVRFYQMAAGQNYAHASGGGYASGFWNDTTVQPGLPLTEIPPLVFSEIMRDVDLFVGVASVANDPNWADGSHENRHVGYWQRYSFGDLSATAQTRKQVLQRLIPRLKIAARCSFSDKFLVVRGDIRSYKIHLGSGNILMEPNDQYLCIVPARGSAESLGNKVFLPFEGDNMLAIILSKAFLLADDQHIQDPAITRQLR